MEWYSPQSQHIIKEIAKILLTKAGIDYEDLPELDEINSDFGSTDIALVIRAHNITNPCCNKT